MHWPNRGPCWKNILLACVGLAPENNMMLEHKWRSSHSHTDVTKGMEGRHGTSEGAGIRRLLWTWRRNNRRPYEGEGSWREINTWMLSHESSWKAFFFLFQIWIGLGTHETRLCTGSAVCGNEPFIYLSLVHINHINFWTHTWRIKCRRKKNQFSHIACKLRDESCEPN